MIDIRFYIPKDESIPTDLRLYVGENYVEYERTANGFLFKTLIDDEDEAMKVVQQIVNKMKSEHDESEHGVSWRNYFFSRCSAGRKIQNRNVGRMEVSSS